MAGESTHDAAIHYGLELKGARYLSVFFTRTVFVVFCILSFVGCETNHAHRENGNKSETRERFRYWTYRDNGDKPGFGILLVEEGGIITDAKFYIIPPEAETPLKSGKEMPLRIRKSDQRSVDVEIDATSSDGDPNQMRLSLVFKDAFGGNRLRAVMTQHGVHDTQPIEVTFNRQ